MRLCGSVSIAFLILLDLRQVLSRNTAWFRVAVCFRDY